MTIELLSKEQLQILNRSYLKYPLDMAEKDYFLTLILKMIHESPLAEKLVLKGGTGLYHAYLPQLRFSEDLDFTASDFIALEEIKEVVKPIDFLEIKKEFVSDFTIKIERLLYQGILGQANSVKIDIDKTQKILISPKTMSYKNIFNLDFKIKIMDLKEICAEKIRSINERARFRDFYDLTMILVNFNFDLKEIIGLLRQKELREDLSAENIFNNWQIALKGKEEDSENIFYSEELEKSEIEKYLKQIRF